MSSTEYHAIEMECVDDITEQTWLYMVTFGKQFKWLDTCLLYAPMWCSFLPDSRPRKNWISYFMTFGLSIIILIYHTFWICFFLSQDHDFFVIMFVGKFVLNIVSRHCGLYYFWKYFKYPWNSRIKGLISNIPFSHHSAVKHYNNFAVAMVVLLMCIIIAATYQMTVYSTVTRLFIVEAICFYIPQSISVAAYYVICLKYGLYLVQLNNEMTDENSQLTMKDILEKYKLLHEHAKKDDGLYNKYLKLCLEIGLAGRILDTWMNTYFYENMGGWSYLLLGNICSTSALLLFYAVGACFVSENFIKLEKELWNCGAKYVESEVDSRYYNHLMQFMQKYPLNVKVGSLVITKKGCVKFVIVFIAAKILSYSIHWIH